jgi:hypothetical protein
MFRRQELFGRSRQRVWDMVRVGRPEWCRTRPVSVAAFGESSLQLDVVFSVCVYDALPSFHRPGIARSALQNLRPGGTYVVIVPRNDASILARCDPSNAYDDGHVFTRYGTSTTFYANFRSHDGLIKLLRRSGFELEEDRSDYRYVWLMLRRPKRGKETDK